MSFFARLGGSDSSDSGSDSEESLLSGDEQPTRSSMFQRGGGDSDSESESSSEEEEMSDSDDSDDGRGVGQPLWA